MPTKQKSLDNVMEKTPIICIECSKAGYKDLLLSVFLLEDDWNSDAVHANS